MQSKLAFGLLGTFVVYSPRDEDDQRPGSTTNDFVRRLLVGRGSTPYSARWAALAFYDLAAKADGTIVARLVNRYLNLGAQGRGRQHRIAQAELHGSGETADQPIRASSSGAA